jgi:hypothetical protein
MIGRTFHIPFGESGEEKTVSELVVHIFAYTNVKIGKIVKIIMIITIICPF